MEADLDLLGALARYCDFDAATLDRWFRGSGRMRLRWDEPFGDGTGTYGQVCIRGRRAPLRRRNWSPPWPATSSRWSSTGSGQGSSPSGHLTVLEGDPGLGKSTVALDLAARLTTGRPMPGESAAFPAAAALIASCERHTAHTTVPRLLASGADRSKVRLLIEAKEAFGLTRGPQLPDDLPLIEKLLTGDGARLLVLDPLMSMLGRDKRGRAVDAHRDQSIRVLMSAFKDIGSANRGGGGRRPPSDQKGRRVGDLPRRGQHRHHGRGP